MTSVHGGVWLSRKVTYRVELHELGEQTDLVLVVILIHTVHFHLDFVVNYFSVEVCRKFARLVIQRALRSCSDAAYSPLLDRTMPVSELGLTAILGMQV